MEEFSSEKDGIRGRGTPATDIVTSPVSTHSNNNQIEKDISSKQLSKNDNTSDAGQESVIEKGSKSSSAKSNITMSIPSGPQIFVVRPLPNPANNSNRLPESSTRTEPQPYEDKVDFQPIRRAPMRGLFYTHLHFSIVKVSNHLLLIEA